MRSFKSKSISDENVTKNTTTRVKPSTVLTNAVSNPQTNSTNNGSVMSSLSQPAPIKSKSIAHQRNSSGSHQPREVLGELNHNTLTSITSNNSNNTSKVKSVTPQVGSSLSSSRIQIYKQYHQQFKKPRLEKIRKNQQQQSQQVQVPHQSEVELDIDVDVTDYDDNEEDGDYEAVDRDNKYFIEDDDDEELDLLLINENDDKENSTAAHKHSREKYDIPHQIEHPSSLVEHSDDIPHHFDKVNDQGDIIDVLSGQIEDDEEEEDEQEEAAPELDAIEERRQQQSRSRHIPMEPIWNARISQELHTIMRKFSHTVLDENDEDTFDVTMVAEYSPEIFNYLRELENRLSPDPMYMENQDELKWEMRSVLIDWVVQVHNRFNLLPETLYLTVNYIDRFLSKRKVSLSRFQLVGAVALFIAAKYEEINCPTVQEVAYMADNAYSIEDFLKAERFMIDVLEFDMGWPGPMSFLRRTSKADDYDYETRTLAKYFLEITIMDSKFVASPPSWLAAGAHYLSRKLLNRGDWTEAHIFYSGYTEIQLKPLAEMLLESCRDPETHHKAIFEKYQGRRYRRSSTFVQEYFTSLQQD